MKNEKTEEYQVYDIGSERLSDEFERDARRYDKAFTEEEEVRLI